MTPADTDQTTAPVGLDAASEPFEQRADRNRTEDALVEADLLVEDVSIDGMCGVY